MKNVVKNILFFIAIWALPAFSVVPEFVLQKASACSARCKDICKGPISDCKGETNECLCDFTDDYETKLAKDKIWNSDAVVPAVFSSSDPKVGNEICSKRCKEVNSQSVSVKGPSGKFFEYEDYPERKKHIAGGKEFPAISCYCKGS